MTHLIIHNKIQGFDVKDLGSITRLNIIEHIKDFVNGFERRQDCFCVQFPSGNELLYAHKIYEYRFESGFINQEETMKNIKIKKCKNCKGTGFIQMQFMGKPARGLVKCLVCKGTGKVEKE